jgi:cobalt/nickel transport system ATP-binding protein
MADSQSLERYLIEVRNLSFRYADGTVALRGVDFAVTTGEKVAIIGPNGAGKSTLLLCLMGLLSVDGEILIDGQRMEEREARRLRRRMALVFQDPDDQLFMPTLSEDVAFGPRNLGLSEAEVERRVKTALARVGLIEKANRPPHHLSYGEKNRAALAAALAMQADILFLDEPTGNLDPATRAELIRYLRELTDTLIFATHDLDLARALSTKCLLLADGKAVKFAATGEILGNQTLLQEYRLAPP